MARLWFDPPLSRVQAMCHCHIRSIGSKGLRASYKPDMYIVPPKTGRIWHKASFLRDWVHTLRAHQLEIEILVNSVFCYKHVTFSAQNCPIFTEIAHLSIWFMPLFHTFKIPMLIYLFFLHYTRASERTVESSKDLKLHRLLMQKLTIANRCPVMLPI